jgi:hypothetical protein
MSQNVPENFNKRAGRMQQNATTKASKSAERDEKSMKMKAAAASSPLSDRGGSPSIRVDPSASSLE